MNYGINYAVLTKKTTQLDHPPLSMVDPPPCPSTLVTHLNHTNAPLSPTTLSGGMTTSTTHKLTCIPLLTLPIWVGRTEPMPSRPPTMFISLLGQLLRLACVCSLALQIERHFGRTCEAKGLGNSKQIESVDIVHIF